MGRQLQEQSKEQLLEIWTLERNPSSIICWLDMSPAFAVAVDALRPLVWSLAVVSQRSVAAGDAIVDVVSRRTQAARFYLTCAARTAMS
jgi:hypothetical protein